MSSEAASAVSAAKLGGASIPKIGYSVKEAVELTGLSRTTLYEAVEDGRLKCFKYGRRKLFSLEHLSAFLKLYEK